MTYLHPVFPVLITLCVIAIFRPRSRTWRWLGALACLGLFLWAWPPITWLTSATLESAYPVRQYPAGPADAIVVLSSDVYLADPSVPKLVLDEHSYVRCVYAAWLYRNWRSVPVIATGGPLDGGSSVAQLMERALVAEGIPPEMVSTENKSLSTYENAVFTAEILRARKIRNIAVVTEAFHMLRAEQCFRKQGLTVTAAPCAYQTLIFRLDLAHLVPGGKSVADNDNIFHEWIGLAWYKLSRKI